MRDPSVINYPCKSLINQFIKKVYKHVIGLTALGFGLGVARYITIVIPTHTAQVIGLTAISSGTSFMMICFIITKIYDQSIFISLLASLHMLTTSLIVVYSGRIFITPRLLTTVFGYTESCVRDLGPTMLSFPSSQLPGEILYLAPPVIFTCVTAAAFMHVMKSFKQIIIKCAFIALICAGFIYIYFHERFLTNYQILSHNIQIGRIEAYTFYSSPLGNNVEIITMIILLLIFIIITIEFPYKYNKDKLGCGAA